MDINVSGNLSPARITQTGLKYITIQSAEPRHSASVPLCYVTVLHSFPWAADTWDDNEQAAILSKRKAAENFAF